MIQIILILTLIIIFIMVCVWSNPYLVFYNKPEINKFLSKKYLLKEYSLKNIKYPAVIKPKFGSQGKDVKYLENTEDLNKYLKKYGLHKNFIQEYYGKKEAGVFYYKDPFTRKIQIKTVLKDNSKWPSRCGNIYFKNNIPLCKKINTPKKLKESIIDISEKIPGFNTGRYDIRYNSDLDLINGNFKIIELNHLSPGDGDTFKDINCKKWYYFISKKIKLGIYNIFTLKYF